VTQARTLWFFARIMQTPFADDSDGRQAERGFTFLAERMWDHRHGGFYWHIDDLGLPVRESKQLYGHAFALFALSRYAAASESAGAIDLAHAPFELLEQRFHDHDHPGYREFFTADWREPANRQVDWRKGEWFAEIAPDGRVTGEKVGLWKGPYHSGRAVLHSLEILRGLSSSR
jgi:mannose/cellobiose epimerase-like protein (N-acyl-D-glucosamine 2-epimerase family)